MTTITMHREFDSANQAIIQQARDGAVEAKNVGGFDLDLWNQQRAQGASSVNEAIENLSVAAHYRTTPCRHLAEAIGGSFGTRVAFIDRMVPTGTRST